MAVRFVIAIQNDHMLLDKQANKPTSNNTNKKKGKEMFYLTTHSTHFIYGYMASDIW